MSSPKNIPDELRDLNSSLPVHNNQPVFSVPEGYFESLADSILAIVKTGEASAVQELTALSPFLAGISKEMPYSVPLFYFQQNLDGLQGIMETTSSPLLETIGKEMPFIVPQDYFANLPAQVVGKVAVHTAKVIPLFARTWMRTALAAVIGGIIFFSGYQYFTTKNTNFISHNPADTTLQKLVARNEPAMIQEIKKASTKELDEFIGTLQLELNHGNKTRLLSDKEKVKDLLKDVSNQDMDAFLNAIPTTEDEFSETD